jgi:transcriptional regulator with XRE-family HTH domain
MSKFNGMGKRIADTRKERRMSASALAKLVRVTPTAVWNWEKNGTMPRVEVFAEIAKVLGVSEEYLRSGNGASDSSKLGRQSIAAIIDQARNDIAALTGLPPDRVKLNVEFATS